jgi:hypothetical protein
MLEEAFHGADGLGSAELAAARKAVEQHNRNEDQGNTTGDQPLHVDDLRAGIGQRRAAARSVDAPRDSELNVINHTS